MARTLRICKLITAQLTIDNTPGGYSLFHDKNPKTLVLKNLGTGEVEVVDLPLGKSSISFIKESDLNNGAFVKFASEEVYAECDVKDEFEKAVLLNKLKREALELKVA